MNDSQQKLLEAEDKRDILEAAGAAAFGFATLHGYIDWRESNGNHVTWFEKFAVMFGTTAIIFAILRLITKHVWPVPEKV